MTKIVCQMCKKPRWTRRWSEKCKLVAPQDITAHLCKPCRKKRGFEADQPKQRVPYKHTQVANPVAQKQEKKQKKGRFER